MTIATVWLEECKPKVQFVITYSPDNPFHIVVPEHFVKVVKNFDGEDLMRVGKCSIRVVPVTPKWQINSI